MHELHKWQHDQRAPQQGPFYMHIDVLPAMTGVSRFGEYGPPWHYSKVITPQQSANHGQDILPYCHILLC